jgi:tetratricopeptide (TPR) repeat protein
VTALLVFSTASLLLLPWGAGPARWGALFTGVAFAAHPATPEVVCWVKSLDDILAAIFTLAAARQLLLWQGEKRRFVAALAFFAAAVYSKESAVPFAGVVFFLLRLCHHLPWKRCAGLTAPFLALAGLYAANRYLVLGGMAQCAPISGGYWQTLLDTIPALTIYFRLLWGLPPFSIDYSEMPGHLSILSTGVLTGFLVLILWAALTLKAWSDERFRPAALGLLWIALFLLPVSNLVPMMQYVGERFLYLPLAGWLTALGAVLVRWPWRLPRWGPALALLAVWIPVSLTRQGIWRDEVTLFVGSSQKQPSNKRLRENAVEAIFLLPQIHAYFGLDDTHSMKAAQSIPPQKAREMLPALIKGHQFLPEDSRFIGALVISYVAAAQASNAVSILESAVRVKPKETQGWIDLGPAYSLEGNAAKAREAWETALRLEPTNRFVLDRLRTVKPK